jgi:hypothetical protein
MTPCIAKTLVASWLGSAAVIFVAFGIIWPRTADAQRPSCATAPCATYVVPMTTSGASSSQGSTPAWSGVVIQNGMGQQSANQARLQSDKLRNDDLDDGDDVLAGPRHHRRPPLPLPPSRDDAD